LLLRRPSGIFLTLKVNIIMPKGIPLQRKAKDTPVFAAAPLASDHEIGQIPTRKIDDLGNFEPSVIAQVSGRPVDPEKMAMLAFMAEMVTIRVATTTDRNAEMVFPLNINGQPMLFRRGETKTLPRYFVDRLLRLKTTTYGQELVLNKEGIQSYIYPPSTGLKYDFAIIRDDNPLGKSWERAVLAEAG